MKKPMPARPRYLRQCFPSLLPSYLGLQTPQNCLHLNNPPHLRPTTAVFCSLSFQHFEPDPEDVRILQARVGNRGLGRDRTQRIYYAFRSCAGLFCTDEDGMLQEKAWACCDRKPVLSDFSPSILLIFHWCSKFFPLSTRMFRDVASIWRYGGCRISTGSLEYARPSWERAAWGHLGTIYAYIYMCVCVCVCPWRLSTLEI